MCNVMMHVPGHFIIVSMLAMEWKKLGFKTFSRNGWWMGGKYFPFESITAGTFIHCWCFWLTRRCRLCSVERTGTSRAPWTTRESCASTLRCTPCWPAWARTSQPRVGQAGVSLAIWLAHFVWATKGSLRVLENLQSHEISSFKITALESHGTCLKILEI